MECQVCEVRSSVGFCVECQALLCESCGAPCENCGRLSCPKHLYETRGGRSLCTACYEERREKRAHAKDAARHRKDKEQEDSSLTGLADQGEDAEAVQDEALLVSAWQPPQPWQFSLYVALAGVAVVLVTLLFPALRRIPLLGSGYLHTSYVILIFPVLAIGWAILGLIREEYYPDRPKCVIGIGVSVLTAVLAFVALWTDPAGRAESQARATQHTRENLTPEELKDWREDVLKRYER